MRSFVTAILVAVCCLFPSDAWSQDADAAAERARLANERIALLEAEARAREEALARESEAAAQRVVDDEETASPPLPDLSKTLEQIRTLGELRDAGYLTPEEFDRIKQRILGDL